MPMNFERMRLDDIFVGMVLPFDIYDGNHVLLLSRGHVITSAALREKLAGQNMFADSSQLKSARSHAAMLASGTAAELRVRKTSVSIFQLLNEAQSGLAVLLTESPARPFLDRAILGIATNIQTACQLDGDAAIASIFLDRNGNYPFRHVLNSTCLVELMLRNLDPNPTRRLSALAAALTMNVAMLELQEALYYQSAPLSDSQKAEILAHPAAGVEWLKSAGVTDAVWLDAVAQHHEQVDGTGYPHRIAGAALTREARAIGLAERYCAMVVERSYRPPLPSGVVFRKLIEQKQSWDLTLGAILTREVGAYPPGTYVRLASGEIAIVLKRTVTANHPVVRVLVSAQGLKLEGFPKRSTKEPKFHIVGPVAPAEIKGEHDFRLLWDLTTIAESAAPPRVATNEDNALPQTLGNVPVTQVQAGR